MSTNYKLTYFNVRARAEVIRHLFALAEVEYEDIRIEIEEWPQLKEKTMFGQLPMLEFDGKVFCQAGAIVKYLARKFGFAGKTDLDYLKVDMVIDCTMDFMAPLIAIYREKTDESKKEEMKKRFVEEELPKFFANFTKLLDGDGHFIGDELTAADVAFYHFTGQIGPVLGCTFDFTKWPKLKTVRDGVENNPKIAAWIAKRPVTLL